MRLDRVILHPGSPKTGTSGIQKMLHARRESLRAAGVLYPEAGMISDAGVAPGQHALAFALTRGPEDAAIAGFAEALEREVSESGCRTLLLSSEEFFNTQALEALKTLLGPQRYSVYVCLRPHAELLNANYYTAVTHKRISHRPAVFLPWAEKNVRYLDVLQTLRDMSPDVSMIVDVFEHGSRARTAPCHRFCEALELSPGLDMVDAHVEHPTLPAQPTLFLRLINELGADEDSFFRFFTSMHAMRDQFSPQMFVMSPAEIGALEDRFASEGRTIRKLFGDGCEGALFAPVHRPDPVRWADEVGEDTSRVELGVMSRLCALARR